MMKKPRSAATAAALLICLSLADAGFAEDNTKYIWSSYQHDLFLTHSDPENPGQFEATLERIIENPDTSGRKPPPGILAEYGYSPYQHGDVESAIGYFEREARQWPESEFFMNRVIEELRNGAGQRFGPGRHRAKGHRARRKVPKT